MDSRASSHQRRGRGFSLIKHVAEGVRTDEFSPFLPARGELPHAATRGEKVNCSPSKITWACNGDNPTGPSMLARDRSPHPSTQPARKAESPAKANNSLTLCGPVRYEGGAPYRHMGGESDCKPQFHTEITELFQRSSYDWSGTAYPAASLEHAQSAAPGESSLSDVAQGKPMAEQTQLVNASTEFIGLGSRHEQRQPSSPAFNVTKSTYQHWTPPGSPNFSSSGLSDMTPDADSIAPKRRSLPQEVLENAVLQLCLEANPAPVPTMSVQAAQGTLIDNHIMHEPTNLAVSGRERKSIGSIVSIDVGSSRSSADPLSSYSASGGPSTMQPTVQVRPKSGNSRVDQLKKANRQPFPFGKNLEQAYSYDGHLHHATARRQSQLSKSEVGDHDEEHMLRKRSSSYSCRLNSIDCKDSDETLASFDNEASVATTQISSSSRSLFAAINKFKKGLKRRRTPKLPQSPLVDEKTRGNKPKNISLEKRSALTAMNRTSNTTVRHSFSTQYGPGDTECDEQDDVFDDELQSAIRLSLSGRTQAPTTEANDSKEHKPTVAASGFVLRHDDKPSMLRNRSNSVGEMLMPRRPNRTSSSEYDNEARSHSVAVLIPGHTVATKPHHWIEGHTDNHDRRPTRTERIWSSEDVAMYERSASVTADVDVARFCPVGQQMQRKDSGGYTVAEIMASCEDRHQLQAPRSGILQWQQRNGGQQRGKATLGDIGRSRSYPTGRRSRKGPIRKAYGWIRSSLNSKLRRSADSYDVAQSSMPCPSPSADVHPGPVPLETHSVEDHLQDSVPSSHSSEKDMPLEASIGQLSDEDQSSLIPVEVGAWESMYREFCNAEDRPPRSHSLEDQLQDTTTTSVSRSQNNLSLSQPDRVLVSSHSLDNPLQDVPGPSFQGSPQKSISCRSLSGDDKHRRWSLPQSPSTGQRPQKLNLQQQSPVENKPHKQSLHHSPSTKHDTEGSKLHHPPARKDKPHESALDSSSLEGCHQKSTFCHHPTGEDISRRRHRCQQNSLDGDNPQSILCCPSQQQDDAQTKRRRCSVSPEPHHPKSILRHPLQQQDNSQMQTRHRSVSPEDSYPKSILRRRSPLEDRRDSLSRHEGIQKTIVIRPTSQKEPPSEAIFGSSMSLDKRPRKSILRRTLPDENMLREPHLHRPVSVEGHPRKPVLLCPSSQVTSCHSSTPSQSLSLQKRPRNPCLIGLLSPEEHSDDPEAGGPGSPVHLHHNPSPCTPLSEEDLDEVLMSTRPQPTGERYPNLAPCPRPLDVSFALGTRPRIVSGRKSRNHFSRQIRSDSSSAELTDPECKSPPTPRQHCAILMVKILQSAGECRECRTTRQSGKRMVIEVRMRPASYIADSTFCISSTDF